MVTPAQRREVVTHLNDSGLASERRACRLVSVSRSVARYRSVRVDDAELRSRLRALAEQYPRYGYPTLHSMLAAEGRVVNPKRTYRLYREEALQVRRRRRKRLHRPAMPMVVPDKANVRWSVDFVSDQLATGRRFRVLNLVDDYTRECIAQIVDTSICGLRLSRLLDQAIGERSRPQTLVCDNGPELTSKAMFFWSRRSAVKLHFIQPGKPTQNAFVESFNGKFREYCLDMNWFMSIEDAREQIDRWRYHYNEERPHSSVGRIPPAQFARRAA